MSLVFGRDDQVIAMGMSTACQASTNTFRDLRSASRDAQRRYKHLERYNWYRDLFPEEYPSHSNINALTNYPNHTHTSTPNHNLTRSQKRLKRDAHQKAKLYFWPTGKDPRLLNQKPKRQARIFGNKDDGFEIRGQGWRGEIMELESLDKWVEGMNDLDLWFNFRRGGERFEREVWDDEDAGEETVVGFGVGEGAGLGEGEFEERGGYGHVDVDVDEGYDSADEREQMQADETQLEVQFPVEPVAHYLSLEYELKWHRDWAGGWMGATIPCGDWCYCDSWLYNEPAPITVPRTCGLDEFVKGEGRRLIGLDEDIRNDENEWFDGENHLEICLRGCDCPHCACGDWRTWERGNELECDMEREWDLISLSGVSEASEEWSKVDGC